MLGEKPRHARDARALRQFVKRSVAFAQRDRLLFVLE